MRKYLSQDDVMQIVINLKRLLFSFSAELSESNERCLSLLGSYSLDRLMLRGILTSPKFPDGNLNPNGINLTAGLYKRPWVFIYYYLIT